MTYEEKIASEADLTIEKIIDISEQMLPDNLRNRPWLNLSHGTDLLSSDEQLCRYMLAYGEMHAVKCRAAFQNFPFEKLISNIEIIDWGCAVSFSTGKKMSEADGTAYYIAPEVLKESYDEKCDVWSCGVILYIMLCGYPPFNGTTDEEIFDQVRKGQFDYPKEEWDNISKDAKDLVGHMLTLDPKKRYSAAECLAHPWFERYKDKSASNKNLAKNVCANMKKFKNSSKLEQATIGVIVNQLVSKDERKELLKQFQDWDKNGDGVLSREEIIEGYRKTYGAVDENEIDNMIHIIDLDGNGVIDYNEFLNCAINKEKILSNERLEMAFKTFDTDGSGKISVDEIMDIFTKGTKNNKGVNREVFEKMVKEADENGDGEISFSEFKTIMKKFFN